MYIIDLIIRNAQIYNPATSGFKRDAVRIKNGIIEAVGTYRDIKEYSTKNTIEINAGNHLILPAFYDSHTHFLGYVKRQQDVALGDCKKSTPN